MVWPYNYPYSFETYLRYLRVLAESEGWDSDPRSVFFGNNMPGDPLALQGSAQSVALSDPSVCPVDLLQ